MICEEVFKDHYSYHLSDLSVSLTLYCAQKITCSAKFPFLRLKTVFSKPLLLLLASFFFIEPCSS